MYVGRIVAIGKTKAGLIVAMYRVSARSFPHRQTRVIGRAVAIVPKDGFESDIYKNPYIAYNCLRITPRYAVVGNGTHVDPIIEKLETGMRVRDAVTAVLHGMDYEHDHLDTPRIVAVADKQSQRGTLGIIRCDALLIQEMDVKPGEASYVATYEHNYLSEQFRDHQFDIRTVEEGCDYIIKQGSFAQFDRPISAACAIEGEQDFIIGYKDVQEVSA